MALFPVAQDEFARGTWTPGLRSKLLMKKIGIWEPKSLIRRGSGHQWIQYARKNEWERPYFWYGKPSVVSTLTHLFVGYYVERGLAPSDPKFVGRAANDPVMFEQMGEGWHWHGFLRSLADGALRQDLARIITSMAPPEKQCLWITWGDFPEYDATPSDSVEMQFEGADSLAKAKAIIENEVPRDRWVNVMAGVRLSREECLDRQDGIVSDLVQPVTIATQIHDFVLKAMP